MPTEIPKTKKEKELDRRLDEELAETFPASDAPTVTRGPVDKDITPEPASRPSKDDAGARERRG